MVKLKLVNKDKISGNTVMESIESYELEVWGGTQTPWLNTFDAEANSRFMSNPQNPPSPLKVEPKTKAAEIP